MSIIACKGIDYTANPSVLEGSSCRLYGANKVRSDPGQDDRQYCSLQKLSDIQKKGINLSIH